MTLDYAGRERLRSLQQKFDIETYQQVPPTSGTDGLNRLSLTIDAACRIIDVRIRDIDGLRVCGHLREALDQAFRSADTERALASLRTSGACDEYAARGAARIRGEVPIDTGDLQGLAASMRYQFAAVDADDDLMATDSPVGRSGNGYLAIQLAEDGSVTDLDIDASWLSAARPENLRRALLEAASALRDGV